MKSKYAGQHGIGTNSMGLWCLTAMCSWMARALSPLTTGRVHPQMWPHSPCYACSSGLGGPPPRPACALPACLGPHGPDPHCAAAELRPDTLALHAAFYAVGLIEGWLHNLQC